MYAKLLALVLAIMAVFSSSSVSAGGGRCDELVDDDAGVFKDRITAVQQEAQALTNLGAEVRVITIESLGSFATVEAFQKDLERQCPSWQAADGGRKNNLITVIAAVKDRKTGLFYGSEWKKTLDPALSRIQADRMNPRFRDNDFAGGFVNGLSEIRRLVDIQTHPTEQTTRATQREAPPTSPPDLSGLWTAIQWIVILGFGTLALFIIVLAGRFYYEGKQKREAAQQTAQLAKSRAQAWVLAYPAILEDLTTQLELVKNRISREEGEELQTTLNSFKALADRGISAFQNLGQAIRNPDQRLSAEQYDNIALAYRQTIDEFTQADVTANVLRQRVAELKVVIIETPRHLETARIVIYQAGTAIDVVMNQGFKAHEQLDLMVQTQRLLTQAHQSLEGNNYSEASQKATQAEELARKAKEEAENLPKTKEEIASTLTQLELRIANVAQAITDFRRVYLEMEANHAKSSLASVQGNGSEAEKRLRRSQQALSQARQHSDQQEWAKAKEIVEQIKQWLGEAESLLRSIRSLRDNLQAAKRDLPGEITAAQADIDKAFAYIAEHREDLPPNSEDNLRQAQSNLAAAQAQQTEPRPDYPLALKLAKQANATADEVLEKARSQYEELEREKRKAARELADAQAAVSRAREFIEDHSYAGRRAKTHLAEAQESLAKAQTTQSPAARLSHAEEAHSKADSAYRAARDNFEEQYHSRRSEGDTFVMINTGGGYRQEERSSGASSSSWGSSSDDDDSGGGGSSSWGFSGGDSGGGGSSDFGSSGGGGGGESDW